MDERGLPRIAFDNIHVGDGFGPVEYVVTQENIDRFRKAVGNPKANYPTVSKRHAATLLETLCMPGSRLRASTIQLPGVRRDHPGQQQEGTQEREQ